MDFNEILNWLAENPALKQALIFLGTLVISFAAYLVTRKVIVKIITKLVRKSKSQLDDMIFEKVISQRIGYIVPVLIFYYFADFLPKFTIVIQRITYALLFIIILTAFTAFLNTLNGIYEKKKQFKGRPIKGLIQTIVIGLYIFGILVLLGILTGHSIWMLLSSLGALTAVLILVFRDTILAFVASLQITSNDLVRLNDWIEVPKYGADGDVIEIALHSIKIQNFDKTITVIPTHKLIEHSFKNWRGMEESGGRRIKRSIYIDISSIKFCSQEMLKDFEKINLLTVYLQNKRKELKAEQEHADNNLVSINVRRLTNIGTFRAYIEEYLRKHEQVHQNMTFLVRQLPPGPTGLPLELYVFCTDIDWIRYEAIQADIFDHLLAIAKEFELRVFQYPGGKEFQITQV